MISFTRVFAMGLVCECESCKHGQPHTTVIFGNTVEECNARAVEGGWYFQVAGQREDGTLFSSYAIFNPHVEANEIHDEAIKQMEKDDD